MDMRSEHGQAIDYDQATPVLILKMGAQPLHHGTLGVIRSLGRVGVPVYSSREAGAAPATTSRYHHPDDIGVLSPSTPELSLAKLRAFQRRVGQPVVIIPIDDKGALFLAENAAALRPDFLLPRQKPDLPRTVASKAHNPQLCATTGVATPRCFVVRSLDDLAAAGAALGFPAVMKIAQPWLLPQGRLPTILARSQQDAAEYWTGLHAQSDADAVIQEYIPGDQVEDWFYHGYHREGGGAVVGFTGRKLRSYPPFLGATSYGVSAVNEELLAIAQRMLRELGYAGIVSMDFVFDKRDRLYKFVDFNPRLGAQFQFLRSEAGIDVVRAMHLDLTQRAVPRAPQADGRLFVSDFTDVAALPAYLRRGTVSPGRWLGQVLGADEYAWFAADDIRPFASAVGQFSKRLATAWIRKAVPALAASRRPSGGRDERNPQRKGPPDCAGGPGMVA
jgi:predicted ATP-grasp superfamily ATP-dependent carboligase